MPKLIKCKTCQKEISKNAKVCPGCGAKQKGSLAKNILIGFVALLVLSGIISGAGSDSSTQETSVVETPKVESRVAETTVVETPVTEATPSVTISAADLSKAFEDNEIKANQDYKDKLSEITGVIEEIGESFGSTYIVLSSGKEYSIFGVQCYFEDKEQINLITQKTKGDTVAIIGKIEGKSLNVEVKNCKFKK